MPAINYYALVCKNILYLYWTMFLLLWFIFELAMVQMNYNNVGEKLPERYEGGRKPHIRSLSCHSLLSLCNHEQLSWHLSDHYSLPQDH